MRKREGWKDDKEAKAFLKRKLKPALPEPDDSDLYPPRRGTIWQPPTRPAPDSAEKLVPQELPTNVSPSPAAPDIDTLTEPQIAPQIVPPVDSPIQPQPEPEVAPPAVIKLESQVGQAETLDAGSAATEVQLNPPMNTRDEGSSTSAESSLLNEAGDSSIAFSPKPQDRFTMVPGVLRELYGLLVVLSGPQRHQVFKIDQRLVTIGRIDADIVLDDPAVGRQHAVITIRGNDQAEGEIRILDRGPDGLPTRAGTLVNDRQISDCVLQDRDRITLAQTDFVFIKLWLD